MGNLFNKNNYLFNKNGYLEYSNVDKLKSILLITNNYEMQTILDRFLKTNNYSFNIVNNAFMGIEFYKNHSNDVSIILNNFELPDMTGIDLYCILKLINPDLNILMLSSFESIIDHFKDLDLKGIYSNPIDLAELTEVLDHLDA